MKIPVVMCSVCNKPVDRLESWHDQIAQGIVIMASCHGDQESMILRDIDIYGMSAEQLDHMVNSGGLAFRPFLDPCADAKTITSEFRQPALSAPFKPRKGL